MRKKRGRPRLEEVITLPTTAPPFVAPRPAVTAPYIPIPTYEDPDEHLGVIERLYDEIFSDYEATTRQAPPAGPSGPFNIGDIAPNMEEWQRRYPTARESHGDEL